MVESERRPLDWDALQIGEALPAYEYVLTQAMVDLRFLRPVRAGDTVTVTGQITGLTREANGQRVTLELTLQNQHGETTAAGLGAALVPTGCLPPSE